MNEYLQKLLSTIRSGETLRREIHPEVRIISEKDGTVDYIASDETIDSYREIVRAAGWKFDEFAKNPIFVDSHNYSSIGCCLGKIVSWQITGGQLVERVQWAKDMPGTLAEWGWKMTVGGFLKAVSVGFQPTKYFWPDGSENWTTALAAVNQPADAKVGMIWWEQQQKELSACVIGANPNALAKAYKAGVLSESDLDGISQHYATAKTVRSAATPADVGRAKRRARAALLLEIDRALRV